MNWFLLKNSLLVSGLTTLLAVSFGLIGALWLAGLPRRWRSGFLAMAIIALALPPFLVTNCWLHFLGYTGVWRSWLPLNLFSPGGTIWILSLWLWPVTLLAVSSAWRRLEPPQLESDTAVTGWSLVRGLLLPLGRRALAQSAILTFVLALNNFAVPAILQIKVFPVEMWVRFNTSFDTIGALQLSWPLVLGPLALLLWFARRALPWPHLAAPVPARLFRRQLGPRWFWSCGAGTVLLCLMAVGLPLLQIFTVRRTWTELPGALAAGGSAVWNSFWFAALSATLVIAISLLGIGGAKGSGNPKAGRNPCAVSALGFRISAFLRTSDFGLRTFWGWLLWLPFLIPGVLLGIGLILAFNRPWSLLFYQSAGIVILAFVIRYLALGWNTVAHAAQTVDLDLLDVARLEGATRWQRLRHVQWPQIAPQAAAAWYVVFLLCLWDVESMLLVVPPGGETLALRIFNLLHYGHNAQVNALCLTLLGVAVAPLALWQAWMRMRRVWRAQADRVACGARPAVPATLLFVCAPLFLTGCSPTSSANDVPIRSEIFSRVQVIGTRGVGVGQFNKPRSVAVDAQDNLYAVDMTGRVQEFSPAGVFRLSWQMPQTDKGKPKGMCRDLNGNIVVIEPHYSRLNVFSPAGKLLAQWGEHGTNAGQLSLPRAVAINSRGEIFISEYQETERIQKFAIAPAQATESTLINTPLQRGAGASAAEPNPESVRGLPASKSPSPTPATAEAVSNFNEPLTTPLKRRVKGSRPLPSPPKFLLAFGRAGTGPGEFNRPEGLCVDAQDRVYVADSCNHRIQVFSDDGKFLRAYGKAGTGKGELSYPYDICVDAAGRQYVCEFGNSRIQVFDARDRPLEIIGGPGAEPGRFSNPWGVALDSAGNLYAADSQNHRVQKLIRNPKAEIRNPKEGRNPKSEIRNDPRMRVLAGFGSRPSFGFRISDFGLLSDFGFRISAFYIGALPFVQR